MAWNISKIPIFGIMENGCGHVIYSNNSNVYKKNFFGMQNILQAQQNVYDNVEKYIFL